jgi:hypothetical protein
LEKKNRIYTLRPTDALQGSVIGFLHSVENCIHVYGSRTEILMLSKQASKLLANLPAGLTLRPEDGGRLIPVHMASHPIK